MIGQHHSKGTHWKWGEKSKYSIKDFHRFYRSMIDRGTMYDINQKLYNEIICRSNQLYVDALMEGRAVRPLPGLGEFQVHKYKSSKSGKVVDWASYYNRGVYKLILNEHSDGFRFFVKWTKNRKLRNIRSYRFSLTTTSRKKLHAAVLDGLDAPVRNLKATRLSKEAINEIHKYK